MKTTQRHANPSLEFLLKIFNQFKMDLKKEVGGSSGNGKLKGSFVLNLNCVQQKPWFGIFMVVYVDVLVVFSMHALAG